MIGLAPDPAVPQRDRLLDSGAVARLLGVRAGTRTYVKYRLGESLRVVHRLEGRHVAARTFPAGESEAAFERARASAVPVAGLPPVLHAAELDAVLWTFPNDRRLGALPLLADGPRLLGRPCRSRLVGYAAERSASAQCLDTGGRVLAYAKVYAGDGAARERATLEAVARSGVRVPRVLQGGPALVLEPIAGPRLDTLPPGACADALRRLGAALARLHALAPPPRARFDRLEPERLATAAAVIARARPEAAGPAGRVLAALLERGDRRHGPAVCLHGDASPRNAILADAGIALVDLEDAAAGPAAADLGQVLAGLLAARVEGGLDAVRERALAAALLAGYAEIAPLPARESLRWHLAACVLARVALPAVSRVRPRLLARLRPLLEAAEGVPG